MPYSRSSNFSPMLSSRSFIILHFAFRSVVNLESFCLGCKGCNWIHFFACGCPVCVWNNLLKKLSLLYCISFAPLSKISWLYLWGHLGDSLSILFHWSIYLFLFLFFFFLPSSCPSWICTLVPDINFGAIFSNYFFIFFCFFFSFCWCSRYICVIVFIFFEV